MSRIRWIHFSDLHLNLTGTETKRLRRKSFGVFGHYSWKN